MKCPHCKNDDESMLEWVATIWIGKGLMRRWFCKVCSKTFEVKQDE